MTICLRGVKTCLFSFFCFILSHSAFGQEPSWIAGYPVVQHGASSIDITVDMNASGSVYYVIYNVAQSGITSAQLKSDALTGTSASIVRKASVAVTINTAQTIQEVSLTPGTTYYVYVIGESAGGLMSSTKISFTTNALPQRQQGFYNFSNASMSSYLMYFPEAYYMDKNTHPLLIFLNGDAQMSKGATPDPFVLLQTGLPQIIDQGKDIPMIVASPQGIWAWDNTETDLDAYIEFLKANYRVDPSQIFLTGISAGGKGVFQYTNVYTTKIRAVVPISTWPEPTDVHNFVNVPVWAFMGNSDTNGGLINWIAALQALGAQATYTGLPGGHDPSVWNTVYSGAAGDIYNWMLTRGTTVIPNKPPVVNAGADEQVTLPIASVQITGTATDPDGTIASMAWTEVSGPAATLTNATTPVLTLTGLAAGTYVFQFSATDNSGSTTTDQMTLVVNAASGTVTREFDVNLTWAYNLQGGTWNDFVTTNGGSVGNSAILFDNTNKTSTIKLSVTSAFLNGTNNHGVVPGIYPSNVMMYYLRSTTTTVGALQLSGLDVTKLYDFSLLSSNVDSWYPSDTKFTVGTQSAVVNGTGNSSTLANFSSISPNAAGQITITVAPATTNSANNGIINAIILKEKSGTAPPPPVNVPPVVNAGIDKTVTLPLAQVILAGTATDSDGTIASLLWTEVSGPAVTMAGTTTTSVTLTNLLAGTYTFQLSATDNSNATTTDQVILTVDPANVPPVVNAGADQNYTLPLSQIIVSGSATDPDGTIASVLWTKVSGPVVTLTTTTTTSLTLTNVLVGTYVFQLSATDNSGATSTDQVTVTVSPVPNILPVVNAGPDEQYTLPQTQIQITGSATDPDGTVVSVLWTLISGPAITLSNKTTTVLTLTNILTGSYIFQLSATDNSGGTSTDRMTLTVVAPNVPPVVNAGPDQQFTLPLAQIQISSTAVDPDGTLASLLWTELSGPAATFTGVSSKILTLTNVLAGTYVLQFTATDNLGASSSDQVVLTVNPAPVAPPREFDINLTWAYNLAGGTWNDFVVSDGGTAGTTAVLFDNTKVTSGISLSIMSPFVDGVNNHGVVPGLYANNVMQYYLRSTTTTIGVLKLSGLDVTKQYDFSILSSNVDVWYPSTTLLTIAGQSVTIDAKGNSSKLASFTNVAPTTKGELTITVAPSTTTDTNDGIINSIILTEHSATTGARTSDVASSGMSEPVEGSFEENKFVSVYPNPADQYVNVEINNTAAVAQIYSLSFLDSKGVSVYSATLQGQDNDDHLAVKIPTDFMPTGFYILSVTSPQSGVHHLKMIKK